MTKPFLSFEEQINHLETDRNLIISDRAYAKSMLQQIGYFGLIYDYKSPFKNPTTKKYRDGTSFSDIVALYKFDENLRELFMKYLLRIERHLRSLLSYYFTEKFGEQQKHYLNPANYTDVPECARDVARMVASLNRLANENDSYPYINQQRHTYHNVPLWVLVNALSFGSLSKYYNLLTPDLRSKIARHFKKVNTHQLEQFLGVIVKYRNVCAHNERLFSYQTRNDIPNMALHRELAIPKKGTQYSCGKHDLFAVVIAFRYLLSDDDFKKFKESLLRIITHYLRISTALSESELYKYMGFPSNWQNISTCGK